MQTESLKCLKCGADSSKFVGWIEASSKGNLVHIYCRECGTSQGVVSGEIGKYYEQRIAKESEQAIEKWYTNHPNQKMPRRLKIFLLERSLLSGHDKAIERLRKKLSLLYCRLLNQASNIQYGVMSRCNIEDILDRGQGDQFCCVAWSLASVLYYQGKWGNGSIRFLHCICKMLDGGMERGTTVLTGFRAWLGWSTCDEKLWPTDVNLSIHEFEDWQNIPQKAWEDAKNKRTQENKALLASWSGCLTTFNCGGRIYKLLTSTISLTGSSTQPSLFSKLLIQNSKPWLGHSFVQMSPAKK